MATVKEGYLLNNPPCITKVEENKKGKNPDRFSFATLNAKSAVIDTIKKAEDGNGYIIRLYEAQNMREEAEIKFGFGIKEVYECDCLENNLEKFKAAKNSVKVKMGNFEIKTLRVVAK